MIPGRLFKQRALDLEGLVCARERACRARLIRFASARPSPLTSLAAALRHQAEPLPLALVGRREALRAAMLSALPSVPDELTQEVTVHLIGQLADGLALAGTDLGELPQRLAEIVSAQLIPYPETR